MMPVNRFPGRAPTACQPKPSSINIVRVGVHVSARSFGNIRASGQPLEEQMNEAVGSGSQLFAFLDNVVLSPIQLGIPRICTMLPVFQC